MNIFVLDKDPVIAASYLCDKHIVKMGLESAQILSSVSWKLNSPAPYKPTHIKHPCVIWAGESIENWYWLWKHAKAILNEYSLRYNKIHKSEFVIDWLFQYGARPVVGDLTDFVLCMPDKYKSNDTIDSYRKFYFGEKITFATWRTQIPYWFR